MDAGGLLWLYDNIDIFALVVARLAGFFVILPVFSGTNVPAAVRVGLAVIISAVIMGNAGVAADIENVTSVGYVLIVVLEFAVGLICGFAVYMALSAFYLVGQLIDFQIGFSMVSVFDPASNIQAPITGNLLYLMVLAFFIETGGLQSVIYGIADSYRAIPIGAAFVAGNGALLSTALDLLRFFFVFGVKISLPVVGAILLVDIALGLLTKAVPQMNVFVVGMPIKLLVGLIVIYTVLPAFLGVYQTAYDNAAGFMAAFIKDMVR